MRVLISHFIVLLFILFSFNSLAQTVTTTFDYGPDPHSSNCNIYATDVSFNGYIHRTTKGYIKRASYGLNSSTIYGIAIPCEGKYISQVLHYNTSAFSIGYHIKKNYKYTITLYGENNAYSVHARFTTGNTISSEAGQTTCTTLFPADDQTIYNDYPYQILGLDPQTPNAVLYNTVSGADYNYMELLANPGYFSGPQSIFLTKIIFEETPPFSISTITTNCLQATSVTINAVNNNNISGITQYTWNLGANSGWKLQNGTAAPSTIVTSSPSLNLISPNNIRPQPITVSVNINGTNFTSLPSPIYVQPPYSATYSIIGANVICGTSSGYTMQVNGSPVQSTVSWYAQAPIVGGASYQLPLQDVYTLSPSGNSATITKKSDGNISLFAKTQNACGYGEDVAIVKDVTLGKPQATNNGAYTLLTKTKTLSGTVNTTNATTSYVSMAFPNNNQYTFTKNSSINATWQNTGNGTMNFTFNPVNSSSNINFNLACTNSCGTSNSPLVFYYSSSASFTASPNPASSSVTIAMDKTSSEYAKFYAIKVTDQIGTVRKIAEYKQGLSIANISVAGLESGTYTVSIFDGKGWISKALLIKK